MPVRSILRLGNPLLREHSAAVTDFGAPTLRALVEDLRDTLYDFRARSGFGRGIAAPQLGVSLQAVYLDTGSPLVLLNPVITRRSRATMTLWDDCFSFPDLKVKVKRNVRVAVRYRNLQGEEICLSADGSLAELLQHEIDHLNGILAVDRAIDSRHIVYRTEIGHGLSPHGVAL